MVDTPRVGSKPDAWKRGVATINYTPGIARRVANVNPDKPEESLEAVRNRTARRVTSVKRSGVDSMKARNLELVKGSNRQRAVLRVKEGMWEHRRGHKVDGGERRRKEVRAKKRAAERKAARV